MGWIQDDGTVKGGTGWGVELAKFFNRELHVFDQEKNAWFESDVLPLLRERVATLVA